MRFIFSLFYLIIAAFYLSLSCSRSFQVLFTFCSYKSWFFIDSSCIFHSSCNFWTYFCQYSSFLRMVAKACRIFCYFYDNSFSRAAFWASTFWSDALPSSFINPNYSSLDLIILSKFFFWTAYSSSFSSNCCWSFFLYVSSCVIICYLFLAYSNSLSSWSCFFQISPLSWPTSWR